ncbi:MAG: MFS transporter [Candidatus Binatia bacterium]
MLHFTGAMSLSMFILFPLYVRALGGTESTIGLVLGVGTAASVAARPIVGTLLDRVGRRRVLLWGNALNAVSFLPFLWLSGLGAPLYVWTIAHDVLWGLLFAGYFTYAADLVPAARRAEASRSSACSGWRPTASRRRSAR